MAITQALTKFPNIGFHERAPSQKPFKDVFHVTTDFAKEKSSTVLKTIYVVPEFLMNLGYLPKDNLPLNNACFAAKMGKLSFSPFEFFKNSYETANSFSLWVRGETKEFKEKYQQKTIRKVEMNDVIRNANNCIPPVWEMADFLTKAILFIPTAAVQTLKGTAGGALILAMGWNAFDSLNWIASCDYASATGKAQIQKSYELTGYLMKLAKEVSYVALGVLTVLSVFFQYVFSPLLFSSLAFSTIAFTILEYYHENLRTEKKLI